MNECLECAGKRIDNKLFYDPRTPPLDTEPCLCGACLGYAYSEMLEALVDSMKDDNISDKHIRKLLDEVRP